MSVIVEPTKDRNNHKNLHLYWLLIWRGPADLFVLYASLESDYHIDKYAVICSGMAPLLLAFFVVKYYYKVLNAECNSINVHQKIEKETWWCV